ncbi:putative germin-like protein 9-2 [Cryptomeria japonica]|uniref:putative germin-like protein 9-2 n=1 Tax=Cryptomeria japonica TaxID=3369 RepID=UPI0025AC775F|nr:putative germin-like protein 9-2 [Cryptomeria japonica]
MEFNIACLLMMLLAFNIVGMTHASDPDITSDFVLPPGQDLKKRGWRFLHLHGILTGWEQQFNLAEHSESDKGINGRFPAGGVNPPRTHPCASELRYLLTGSLEVGFVDTTGKLFTQTLYSGDL